MDRQEKEYIDTERTTMRQLSIHIDLVGNSPCILYEHHGGYTESIQLDNMCDVLNFLIYIKERHIDMIVYTNNCSAHMNKYFLNCFFCKVRNLIDVVFVGCDSDYKGVYNGYT